MKKIYFKKLIVKNFLSIGNEPVIIDFTQGINLITGVNLDKEDTSNGSGKSSLINALYFCLFGKTLKELKTDQIPNTYTKGVCEVSIILDIVKDNKTDTYTITRSLRPSKLKLEKNGNDVTKSTIAQTTEMLSSIINCTNIVFENSIVMDVNNATSFMSQKKVEKRKFLEGILNLGVFGDMLDLARTDFNNTKYNLDIYTTQLQELSQALEIYEQQSKTQKQLFDKARGEVNEKIKKVSLEITLLERELSNAVTEKTFSDLEGKVEDLKKANELLEQKSERLLTEKIILQQRVKQIEELSKKYSDVTDTCIECERSFTSDEKQLINNKARDLKSQQAQLECEISQNNKDRDDIKNKKNKIEKSISTLTVKISEAKDIQNHNSNLQWKIQQLQNNREELKQEAHKSYNDAFSSIISTQKEKVEDTNTKIQDLNQKTEILQASKFILSHEGVKSYVVKKILRVLNSKLNGYLKKLDANIKCAFNEYFEETLWDHYGNERSYNNFSSGEQRRIDLAILFAFQDIRKFQADVGMNISIYDELLDSSLDCKGTELVISLLKDRAVKNKECIYIISHRKEVRTSHITKVINLYKKNGVTYQQ